jgi:hypothetical protein
MNDAEFYRRMRVLVGRRCRFFDGEEWQVLDVLPEEHCLVLGRSRRTGSPIQADAFGNALRRAPETRIVTCVDENGEISEEALMLLESLQPR